MTQELPEEQKRKIEAEENYRQEMRQRFSTFKSNGSENSKRKGCFWSFIAFGLLVLVIALFNSGEGNDSQKEKTNGSSTIVSEEEIRRKEEEKQRKITELGDTFCKERSKPYTRYVNLDDLILWFEKAGETVNLRPVGNKPPVKAKCDKVMELCLDYWSEEDCGQIAEGKVQIGMSEDQLILSWGLPNDQNNTVGTWGVHSQWVYGSFGPYVYLEGKNKNDLKVTSWQD